MPAQQPVLLYDAGCRLCRFAARTVVRLDRKRELGVLPLRDADAGAFLTQLPNDDRFATWRLARADGSLHGFGAGVPQLLRAIRLTRPLGFLLSAVPDAVLDASYRVVARNRVRLGRLVPDGPAPRRTPMVAPEEAQTR